MYANFLKRQQLILGEKNKKEEMVISTLLGSTLSDICRVIIIEALNGVIFSLIVA